MYTGPGMDRLLDLSKTLQRGQVWLQQVSLWRCLPRTVPIVPRTLLAASQECVLCCGGNRTMPPAQILVPQDLFDGPIRDELEIAQLSVRNAGIVCFIPFYEVCTTLLRCGCRR
jgi:hypothetical protein